MRTHRLASLVTLTLALSGAPALAQCVDTILYSPDPLFASNVFGTAVAFDGDTLAIGQYFGNGGDGGRVFIFERQGTEWTLVQTIDSPPAYSGGDFGWSLALKNDVLLVGADGGYGAVFAYERIAGVFEFDQQFETSQPLLWGMSFGDTVTLDEDGDDAIVTAPDASDYGQDARFYHFKKQSGGWIQKQVIAPAFDNTQNASLFSWSVLMDGPLVFVGNSRSVWGSGSGEVWVYRFMPGFGYTKVNELQVDEGPSQFGHSIAKRGNEVAVGAPWIWSNGTPRGGVVVFELSNDGKTETEVATLLPGDEHGNLIMGSNVAYAGNKLVVGSLSGGLANNPQYGTGGAAHLFQKIDGSYRRVAKVGPHEEVNWRGYQNFSVSGTTMAIGSRGFDDGPGEVWMLDFTGGNIDGYCEAGENSVGEGARISAFGFASISTNVFSLRVDDAPANQFGKFYYGPEAQSAPFGEGTACVGGGSIGTFRLLPSETTSATGTFERALDFNEPPADAGAGQILPGSTWYFQYWYRDPQGGGSAFNLSDGLAVSFCP